MVNNLDEDKLKLENYIYFIFTYNDLPHLFEDLIWGILRNKEGKKKDSIDCFGEFCEHSHRFLFKVLNDQFMKKRVYLTNPDKPKDWDVVKKLQERVFPPLHLKNTTLLTETREIVDYWNDSKHEFEDKKTIIEIPLDLLQVTVTCIKLFLLVRTVALTSKNFQKKYPNNYRQKFISKNITIEKEFAYLFREPNAEIVEIFLDSVFGRKNRNILLANNILSLEDIENSKTLQNYYPLYIHNHWRIEKILLEEDVYPFRTTGPHLIDFEKGNWIYIPKTAKYILKLLSNNKKSILISAESGTGKTVISRYIGYMLKNQDYDVFYIDCVKHESKKVEDVIDQLALYSKIRKESSNSILYIFDNVHVLEDELKSKLDICKDLVLCLISERIFNGKKVDDKKTFNFNFIQKINIQLSHWSYRNTIKGIIKQNSQNLLILDHIRTIGNQNLWIYAIVLKVLRENVDSHKKTSIIELFTDNQLIGEKLSEYFERLLDTTQLDIKSSEDTLYLNHIKYFLAILSIFSKLELWTEKRFLNELTSIKDDSPLGCLNTDISISNEVLIEIQSFLIDIFEIEYRNIDFNPGIKGKEFKIPHSQMAIIYKNCILNIFEKSYPGLIYQLTNLYIYYGKYFGTFLNKKWEKWTLSLAPREQLEDSKLIYFDFEKFLNMFHFPELSKYKILNLKSFIRQLKNRSLSEIMTFCERISLDGIPKENDRISQILIYLIFLDDSYWKGKIFNSNYRDLFYFLEMIKESLSEKCLFDFFSKYKDEILEKFSQSTVNYLFRMIFLITNLPKKVWVDISEKLKDFIMNIDADFKDFEWPFHTIEDYNKKMSANSFIHSILRLKIEQYISNSSLGLDIKFLDQIRLYLRDFIQNNYFPFLKTALDKDPNINMKNKSILKKKIIQSNLDQISNYLYQLNSSDPYLSKEFFITFIDEIKFIIDKSNAASLRDFLIEILSIEFNPKIIMQSLLKDWTWFQELFLKFSINELLESCYPILNQFLRYYNRDYANQFESLIYSIIVEKLKPYYNQLENKVDIYKIISNNPLFENIKDAVIKLFGDAITQALSDPDLKLEFFIKLFNEINQDYYTKTLILQEFNFETINSDKSFNNLVFSSKNEDILEFMKILEEYNKWYQLFLDEFKDFLSQKFGEGYRIAQHCSKIGKKYLIELPSLIRNLDIEKITLICNSTYKTWYKIGSSFKNTKIKMKIDRVFQELIHKSIRKNLNLFFTDEFKDILVEIDIDVLFNFFLILFKFHKDTLQNIFNKFRTVIKHKFKENQIKLLNLLEILKIYEVPVKILKEIDVELSDENIIYPNFLNSFNNIDLFKLRKIFEIISKNDENLDEYKEILNEIEFKKNLDVSNLLQVSIALYNSHISLLKKPRGIIFLKGQERTRQVRVEPEIFNELTEGLEEIIEEKSKDFYIITLVNLISEFKDIFINKSFFFSEIILLKMKKSNIFEITQYFKTLLSWFKEFKDVISNLPENFLDFLKSEIFSNFIKESSFKNLYDFFIIFSKIYPDYSKYIWRENYNYFTSHDFALKLKDARFYQTYKFFMSTLSSTDQLTPDIVKLLKEKIENIGFSHLVQVFLELNYLDLAFIISKFRKEIEKIIVNTSKTVLKYELRDLMRNESEIKKLEYVQEKLPIINQKMNEKYFFEPTLNGLF